MRRALKLDKSGTKRLKLDHILASEKFYKDLLLVNSFTDDGTQSSVSRAARYRSRVFRGVRGRLEREYRTSYYLVLDFAFKFVFIYCLYVL